jgi:hypothetical protein
VVRFLTGTRDTFSKASSPAVRPIKPPNQWISKALVPGIECLGHKADHSLLSNVEVKKAWSYTSTPPYSFIVCAGTILSFTFKGNPTHEQSHSNMD